jgi:acyl-CoA synthetase (AMP-forming)/AMP-acid ligase II
MLCVPCVPCVPCVMLLTRRRDLQILYPIVWLAAIGAGGCISGSNPANTISELKHHLKITKPKFIISQKDCFTTIAQAARECGIPRARIFILAPPDARLPDGYLSYETLLGYGEEDWEKFGRDETKADSTIAVLGATSGTTGLPKSAALSHQYLIAQSGMIQKQAAERAHEVRPELRILMYRC